MSSFLLRLCLYTFWVRDRPVRFGNCEKECVFLPSSFFSSSSSSFFFLNFSFVLSGMTTRFSKQKLAEAQEKKANGGTVNGLLSKKKTSDVSKKDSVTKIPPAC